jgi:outer membrane protein OmpA-like peptidoglycan-associated protein
MHLAQLLRAATCTALLVPAAPALAQDAGAQSCVGKARLRGPIWDLAGGQLEPGLPEVFDGIARIIREDCGAKLIIIEAHAFELPAPELNLLLSELRAATVRYELVKRGIPAERLLAAPYGDTRPRVPKSAPDAALENRRITFLSAD